MLRASGVRHGFGGATVLDGIDLSLRPGEIIGLGGPSGAGKSTLGRILSGHLRPSSGQVTLDGTPFALRPRQPAAVQYAPQASELSIDPRWRVGRILRNGGQPDPAALHILGVRPEWEDRYPAELSGGELARVALARLIVPSTRFLICDEVTAPLDAIAATEVAMALRQLAQGGMGILLISHNAALVARHADRSLTLRGGRLRSVAEAGGL